MIRLRRSGSRCWVPVASPKANSSANGDRTIRRECLDWMIPLSEAHLRRILAEWVTHYNRGRPHSAFGPGVPTRHSRRHGRSQIPAIG